MPIDETFYESIEDIDPRVQQSPLTNNYVDTSLEDQVTILEQLSCEVDDPGDLLGETLYIDQVEFSDKHYFIKDLESRDFIKFLFNKIMFLEKELNNLKNGG